MTRGLKTVIRFAHGKDFHYISNKLIGLQRELPKRMNMSLKHVTQAWIELYLLYAKASGIKSWTGRSFASLEKQKQNPSFKTSGTQREYYIRMPEPLLMLSEGFKGKPYMWVKIGAGGGGRVSQSMRSWVKSSKKLGMSDEQIKRKKWIRVRAHPFIGEANVRGHEGVNLLRNDFRYFVKQIWRSANV